MLRHIRGELLATDDSHGAPSVLKAPNHKIVTFALSLLSTLCTECHRAHNRFLLEALFSDDLLRWVTRMVRASRPGDGAPSDIRKYVKWGAGPRAGQSLILTAKARALQDAVAALHAGTRLAKSVSRPRARSL